MHMIGERIRTLRVVHKITQAEFAARIGVTKSMVFSYENGPRLPAYDVLLRIAGLFRVSTDHLLGFSDRLVVDVTGLNAKQPVTVQDVVDTYQRHNRLYRECSGKEPDGEY